MIKLRLAGGLGNQLFQVAAALSWADVLGSQVIVDSSGLERYSTTRSRVFQLFLSEIWRGRIYLEDDRLISKLPTLLRIGRWMPWLGVNDRNFKPYAPTVSANCYFDGYFQTCWTNETILRATKYFINTKDPDFVGDLLAHGDKVCLIHMRGGDFLAQDKFNICNKSYYLHAIELMASKGVDEFKIICEDSDFSKKIVDALAKEMPKKTRIVTGLSGIPWQDDFKQIAIAKYKILSNSTFSWWAAALGVPNADIISPSIPKRGASHRKFTLPNEILLDVQF